MSQSARLHTVEIALLTFPRPSSATGSSRENAVEFTSFDISATGSQKRFILGFLTENIISWMETGNNKGTVVKKRRLGHNKPGIFGRNGKT